MATAKGFRRQAATCAALAAATHDEEGRQRYKRLQQIYLELAEAEELLADRAGGFTGGTKSEPVDHRVS
jgi:hypothetical protein